MTVIHTQKKEMQMFAVIMRSKTATDSSIRQTAIVPVNGAVHVYTRDGGGRGIAGAWHKVPPVFNDGEFVVGQPQTKQIQMRDYTDLQAGNTPTNLLQKLVREAVADEREFKNDYAEEVFVSLYSGATDNPINLIQFRKLVAPAVVEPVVVSPTIQVVHEPEPQPVMVSVHYGDRVVLEELTPAVPITQETIHKEDVMTYSTVAPQQNQADAVLTIPVAHPYFERKFDGLLESAIYDYARKTQTNVLLTGDAGTGKTSSARNYAAKNNLPFVTIECTQQIDQSITQGRFVPTGVGNGTQWKYSQLATAIQQPSVVLINELTRMSPKAASLFLRLLEERELLIEPMNEVIKVHPDCIFIADQNTGLGYTGTSKQDAALVDRFRTKLEFKYDSDIESKFIKSEALLSFANDIRQASEITDEFSVPMSSRILQNFQDHAQSLNFAFAVTSLLNNYPKSDGEREAIKMRFDAVSDEIATQLGVEVGTYSLK